MKIIRTKTEISKRIKKIVKDSDNFTYDNYGSEAADDGNFEVSYSETKADLILKNFVAWLTIKGVK